MYAHVHTSVNVNTHHHISVISHVCFALRFAVQYIKSKSVIDQCVSCFIQTIKGQEIFYKEPVNSNSIRPPSSF